MTAEIPADIAIRLNYRDGMFLTAQLMRIEQSYYDNMTALQNRMLYTPGVLSGLAARLSDSVTLTVAPGAAFNPSGVFVVLPDDRASLSLPASDGKPARVYLTYPSVARRTKDPVTDTVNMAGVLQLVVVGDDAPADGVLLAEISVNDKGAAISVADKRVFAASRLQKDAAVSAAQPRMGNATFNGGDMLSPGQSATQVVYFAADGADVFSAPPVVTTSVIGSTPYASAISAVTTAQFTLTLTAVVSSTAAGPVQVDWIALQQ